MSGEEGTGPRTRIRDGAIVAGAFLLVAGGFGALIGRSVAEAQAVGEMTAVFGALGGMVEVGGSVMVLSVIGLIAMVRAKGMTPVAGTMFAMAGAVILGAVIGQATWTAPPSNEPAHVVRHASGTAVLQFKPVQANFVGLPAATVECDSVIDGEGVGELNSAVSGFGELGTATVRGYLRWMADRRFADLTLFLDLDDLPPGAPGVAWHGTVEVEAAGDARSGATSFGVTRQEVDPASGSWPGSLAGVLVWTCGEWEIQSPAAG
jgi:hypothetical protein